MNRGAFLRLVGLQVGVGNETAAGAHFGGDLVSDGSPVKGVGAVFANQAQRPREVLLHKPIAGMPLEPAVLLTVDAAQFSEIAGAPDEPIQRASQVVIDEETFLGEPLRRRHNRFPR